jgi:uncharacterized protein
MPTVATATSPCLTCGACCAAFRVSFHWREADDAPEGTVPVHLTENLTPHLRCMAGTNQKQPRCAALIGTVGESVRCAIYEQRAEVCVAFGVHWENGILTVIPEDLVRCNQARAHWNLPPLLLPADTEVHPRTA